MKFGDRLRKIRVLLDNWADDACSELPYGDDELEAKLQKRADIELESLDKLIDELQKHRKWLIERRVDNASIS